MATTEIVNLGEFLVDALAQDTKAKFHDLLERPANYTPAELVKMAFDPELTPCQRELVRQTALSLEGCERTALAELAACANLQALQLRGIFANFLHCMYHRDKASDEAAAIDDRVIQIQHEMLRLQPQMFAAERARSAANAKVANDKDGKQAARNKAHQLWLERYHGKHPALRTNEQFATEVMRRWPVLLSSKVICGWCTDWARDMKRLNQSQASQTD
jgi:hypothetical protein